MIVKKEKKQKPIIPILIVLIVAYVMLKVMTGVDNNGGVMSFEVLQQVSDDVLKFWQPMI